jgi:hypothetical protein
VAAVADRGAFAAGTICPGAEPRTIWLADECLDAGVGDPGYNISCRNAAASTPGAGGRW